MLVKIQPTDSVSMDRRRLTLKTFRLILGADLRRSDLTPSSVISSSVVRFYQFLDNAEKAESRPNPLQSFSNQAHSLCNGAKVKAHFPHRLHFFGSESAP